MADRKYGFEIYNPGETGRDHASSADAPRFRNLRPRGIGDGEAAEDEGKKTEDAED